MTKLEEEKINKIENEYNIEQLLKQKKRDRKIKIILIIIIIILLLMIYFLGWRMGKIGYSDVDVVAEPEHVTAEIKVTQGDLQITKNTQMDIFNNQKFNGEKKIAPGSNGTYQFCIKNEAKNDIIYHIKFTDEMQNLVNMKYRLKIDNIYIRGNEKEYISIDELNVENITVLEDSINIFTLEWYWEDNDEQDTYVGSIKEDQYYTLNLEILAETYEKKE